MNSPSDLIALQTEISGLALAFMYAVARTHPNPSALLSALEEEIESVGRGENAFMTSEPQPWVQQCRQDLENALFEILHQRLLPAHEPD